MADIFISYSQKDRDRVAPLVEALTAEGYDVWWDLRIRAGQPFDREIERMLRTVKAVVAVWSKHSVTSDWVRAEAAWAKRFGKLISIGIDGDLELPIQFQHINTQDMTGWAGVPDDPRFRKLAVDIRQVGEPAAVSSRVSEITASKARGSQNSSLALQMGFWAIPVAMAALIIAVVFLSVTQIHVGEGDNITAGRDVLIDKGIPKNVADAWFSELRAQGVRQGEVLATLDQLQNDFAELRQTLARRAEREPAVRPAARYIAHGDLAAAEAQLGAVLDQEIRTQLYGGAAATAEALGQLKSLQLDAKAAQRFEALQQDLVKAATLRGSRFNGSSGGSEGAEPSLPDETLSEQTKPGSLGAGRDESFSETSRRSVYHVAEEPNMVKIGAGSFQLGCVSGRDCQADELPVRTVTFAKPFAIGKYEVTFSEYDRFADTTGRARPDDRGWGRGSRPVINVSWEDARDYANWLSEQTGKSYRLPAEAEWEYAARADTETPWSVGGDASYLGKYAWYAGNASGQTHPVGEKQDNPFGLHDVHGNVWEWMQDCWHEGYEDAPTDGSAWLEADGGACSWRVLRSGSWNDRLGVVRSASRGRYGAVHRTSFIGFRLAQDL